MHPKSASNIDDCGLSVYREKKKEKLRLRAEFNSYTGYGLHASYVVRSFYKFRRDVQVDPVGEVLEGCFEEVWTASRTPKSADGNRLLIAPAGVPVDGSEWFFTMHETTQMPKSMLENVKRAQAIIVPSQWCQQCFDAQGVDVPIYVVPVGVNTEIFYPQDRQPPVCTFGSAGNLLLSSPHRKNMDMLVKAFLEAFSNEKDVRLKIKVRPECPVCVTDDPRVEVVREQFSEMGLSEWFRSLSAYVSPSRSEAFGQMNVQAMACGVPVICCAFGGVTDYHSDAHGYSIDYNLSRALGGYYSTGVWAEPDLDSMIEQLRRVYENRSEAFEKGKAAIAAASRLSWNSVNSELENVLISSGFWDSEPRPPRPVQVTTTEFVSAAPPELRVPVPTNTDSKEFVLKTVVSLTQREIPWNGELKAPMPQIPMWLALRTGGHETLFYMSGDLGDIIYTLPTIQALGGGKLCIGPARDHPRYWLREPMTLVRYKWIEPLLELQQGYLSQIFFSPETYGWKCSVDLNDVRRMHWVPYHRSVRNLVDVASVFFGCGTELWRQKWLTVDSPNRVARFVFGRSPRWHDPKFPWKQVVQKHGANAVFIGFPAEHAAFEAEFGKVARYPTANLLDVARVLAGAEWTVLNQSSPMSVAEGLKVNILREHSEAASNCIFDRVGNVTNPAYVLDLC